VFRKSLQQFSPTAFFEHWRTTFPKSLQHFSTVGTALFERRCRSFPKVAATFFESRHRSFPKVATALFCKQLHFSNIDTAFFETRHRSFPKSLQHFSKVSAALFKSRLQKTLQRFFKNAAPTCEKCCGDF